jgi:hypothetical protein
VGVPIAPVGVERREAGLKIKDGAWRRGAHRVSGQRRCLSLISSEGQHSDGGRALAGGTEQGG